MYTLKIQPLNAVMLGMYENHGHYHEGDAGIDLFMPTNLSLMPGQTEILSLEIKAEMVDEDEKNTPFMIFPRSSIYKTGFRLSNSVGLIDAYYREPIKATFDNCFSRPCRFKIGDRLLQIVAPNLQPMKLEIVDKLSDGDRSGFGSTGKGTENK